jgi:hypothetical protein
MAPVLISDPSPLPPPASRLTAGAAGFLNSGASIRSPSPDVAERKSRSGVLRNAWGGGVFAVSVTQAVCQAEQRPADGPTLFTIFFSGSMTDVYSTRMQTSRC